jgi:hypothetical protein
VIRIILRLALKVKDKPLQSLHCCHDADAEKLIVMEFVGASINRKAVRVISKSNCIKFLNKSTRQIALIRVFSFLPAKKVVLIYQFMQKKSWSKVGLPNSAISGTLSFSAEYRPASL